MKNINIKNFVFIAFLTAAAYQANAQNTSLKAGANPTIKDPSAVLELEAADKGVLFPRVLLTSTTVAAPVTTPANGLTVFNTKTAGDVTPGYYYWSQDIVTPANSKWVRLITSTSTSNLYTVDGSLTSARTLTHNSFPLTFEGSTERTRFETSGKLTQEGISGGGTLEVKSAVVDGLKSQLTIQAFPKSSVNITAMGDATGLNFITNYNTISSPISFSTTPGAGGTGNNTVKRMIITGDGNVGIGLNTPLDKLDIDGGNVRIRTINDNAGLVTDKIVVAGSTGILKTVNAAMPKFFYMPSIIVPTSNAQLNQPGSGKLAGDTFNDATRQGSISLYGRYAAQFGTTGTLTQPSSPGAPVLPVLPASALHYYITWYDTNIFTVVNVDAAGLMTYTVATGADVTIGSFMNIVFSVK
jgi:hypothetical protein